MKPRKLHISSLFVVTTSLLAGLPAKIEVTGSAADKKAWEEKIERCRESSAWFKTWYDNIESSNKVVKVVLVRNKKTIIIDSFATNEVDLSDIDDYPELDPPTTLDQCQLIVHILEERFQAASNPKGARQTWREWFGVCHQRAMVAENEYRASLGYSDKIVGATLSADGKKIQYEWKMQDGSKRVTSVPIADGRAEGRCRHLHSGHLGDGRRFYDVTPQPGAAGDLTLPPSLGGETLPLLDMAGMIRFAVKRSAEFPDFNEVEILALDLITPPAQLPSGQTVGPTMSLLRRSVYGWHHPATGQLAVAFDGDLFIPTLLDTPTFGMLTGNLDLNSPADFVFHIAMALLVQEPTNAAPTIELGAPARLGTTVPLLLESAMQPDMSYLTLFSLSATPRFELPDGRNLPIAVDALTLMGIQPSPVFQDVSGTLDRRGRGQTVLHLPQIPGLAGLEMLGCLVTFEDLPAGLIGDVSNPVSIRFTR